MLKRRGAAVRRLGGFAGAAWRMSWALNARGGWG